MWVYLLASGAASQIWYTLTRPSCITHLCCALRLNFVYHIFFSLLLGSQLFTKESFPFSFFMIARFTLDTAGSDHLSSSLIPPYQSALSMCTSKALLPPYQPTEPCRYADVFWQLIIFCCHAGQSPFESTKASIFEGIFDTDIKCVVQVHIDINVVDLRTSFFRYSLEFIQDYKCLPKLLKRGLCAYFKTSIGKGSFLASNCVLDISMGNPMA